MRLTLNPTQNVVVGEASLQLAIELKLLREEAPVAKALGAQVRLRGGAQLLQGGEREELQPWRRAALAALACSSGITAVVKQCCRHLAIQPTLKSCLFQVVLYFGPASRRWESSSRCSGEVGATLG